MLGAPDHGLRTDETRNPNGWMRLLHRQDPRIHEAVVIVLALVTPGARRRPGLDDEVMGFVEAFTVVGRVDIVGNLLAARSPHPTRHQAATGDDIDHRELFRQSEGVGNWQRVAQQHDLDFFCDAGKDGGLHIHHRSHAEWGLMMFVEHYAIEAQLFGVNPLVEILMIEDVAFSRVKAGVAHVGQAEVTVLVWPTWATPALTRLKA